MLAIMHVSVIYKCVCVHVQTSLDFGKLALLFAYNKRKILYISYLMWSFSTELLLEHSELSYSFVTCIQMIDHTDFAS